MPPSLFNEITIEIGMECSAKLFYTGKKEVYYDTKFDNDFLAALAEGGFSGR
jgi:hypothetical protein